MPGARLGWLGPHAVVVVIEDGSDWTWYRASLVVRRCEILDFWHAMEHAWAYARTHAPGSRPSSR